MINPQHFAELIIKPTLTRLGLYSVAAERLLLGTAIQESYLYHLKQLGNGPALGVYQIEPFTHDDIWRNYLRPRADLRDAVSSFLLPDIPQHENLVGNLFYSTAMARIFYRRIPQALPHEDNLAGQAQYWKLYYNTPKGKGTVSEYIHNFQQAMTE